MSCSTEKRTMDELVARNAGGINSMRGSSMPVMVPIQEKDWDTMVGLLESAVDFQPRVYSLVRQRATPEQMADLLNQYLEQEQAISQSLVSQVQESTSRMENLAQQAGRNLEKTLSDSLERGSQLEAAIAQAAKRRSWKTWILIIVVSVLASTLGAALSALLCMHWLL